MIGVMGIDENPYEEAYVRERDQPVYVNTAQVASQGRDSRSHSLARVTPSSNDLDSSTLTRISRSIKFASLILILLVALIMTVAAVTMIKLKNHSTSSRQSINEMKNLLSSQMQQDEEEVASLKAEIASLEESLKETIKNHSDSSQKLLNETKNLLSSQKQQNEEEVANLEEKITSLEESLNKTVSNWKLCNAGWYKFGNYYCKLFKQLATYQNAFEECRKVGARLASSVLQNQYLSDIHKSIVESRQRAWVGLENQDGIAPWKWSNGTSSFPNNTNWFQEVRADVVNICALLPTGTPKLKIAACNTKCNFLCEIVV